MTAFEQLEGLNPVPDTRGNPGKPGRPHRRKLPRRAAVLGIAAAAATIVLGGLAVGSRNQEPIDLAVADESVIDAATPTPTSTAASQPLQDLSGEELPPTQPSTETASSGDAEAASRALARLTIPAIDIDEFVGDGVSISTLRTGPGLYPEGSFPGQAGNASIAGLRTTFGAPFHRLDELVVGDSMYVTTMQGVFEYVVRDQTVVGANETEVLEDFGDDRLTLTTQHPKYSYQQRLIVVADLIGEPALPFVIRDLPSTPTVDTDGDGTPLLTDQAMRDSQPYFSFIGNDDAELSARGFLSSQFPGWGDQVEVTVRSDTDGRAAVRWADPGNDTAGWIMLFVGDGLYNVWEMTMDGVAARMYQTSNGGRGFASSESPGRTLEVLRPVPFSMTPGRDPFTTGSLRTEPLAVAELVAGRATGALVQFDVTRGEHFQEVSMAVRNDTGEQVGGLAASLSLPMVNEIAVITQAGESDALRSFVVNEPEVIAGPLGWDRWQSVYFLTWLIPDLAPQTVDEIPAFEVTTLAFRPITSADQYSDQLALLAELEGFGQVVWVPERTQTEATPEIAADYTGTPPAAGYTIDELPSVDICRGVRMMGWALPQTWVNDDRQVFATPEAARDSAAETAIGHTVEFRTSDDVVSGFARSAEDYPWRFLSLAVIEQVDDGWVLDRWERATC